MSMKFVVGSMSERKNETVRKVVEQLFPLEKDIEVVGCNVQSLVPDTPYDDETYQGARNRAVHSKENDLYAHYYIGLESGLVERYGHIYEEAWAVVIASDGWECYGYSSGLKVPDYILGRMKKENMAHSDVMALIEEEFGKLPNDTWGTYTGGAILRTVSLEEALRNAFIQITATESGFYRK
jgi:non-canonical (house-cleaning) NTP pyrophosphatase